MPLQTQIIDIPLAGGLNQTLDARVMPPGSFLALDNVGYDHAGALTKRAGMPHLGLLDSDGGTINSPETLVRFGAEALAVNRADGTPRLLSLVDHAPYNTWRIVDGVGGISVREKPLARGHANLVGGQVARTSDGLIVYAWVVETTFSYTTPNFDVVYRVVDAETGFVVTPDTVLTTSLALYTNSSFAGVPVSGPGIKMVSAAGVPVLLVGQFPNLVAYSFGAGSWSAPVAIFTSSGGGAPAFAEHFDICAFGNKVAIAYTLDRATGAIAADRHMHVGIWTNALAVSVADHDIGSPTGGGGASGNPAPRGITVAADSTHTFVAWSTDDGAVVGKQFSSTTLTLQVGPTIVHNSTITDGAYQLCSCLDGAANARVAWFGVDASFVTNPRGAWSAQLAVGGAVSGTTIRRDSFVLSAPFLYSGVCYQALSTPSGVSIRSAALGSQLALERGTLHTLDDPNFDQGLQLIADLGPNLTTFFDLPCAAPPSGDIGQGSLGLAREVILTTDGRVGIDTWDLNPASDPASRNSCEANGLLFFSGGLTSFYDGEGIYEAGFLCAPAATSATSAGALTGTFSWIFVWEWWDAKGNLHRSQLSNPTSLVVTSSRATFSVVDFGITRRGRDVNGVKRKVRLAVYRTTNGGSTYFRVNNPVQQVTADESLPGDGSRPFVTYVDNIPDATLTANAYGTLYADPVTGVLDNEAPPASLDVHTHRSRIWLVSAEDDHELWYSQELLSGEGPRFNSVLTARVDDALDGFRALASLDNALVAFTPTGVYLVDGDGPDQTGGGGGFAISRIASPVGCDNPRSVVSFHGGVLFQAPNGLMYLLDRSRSLQFVGQAVQDTTPGFPFCQSATLDEARQRILWILFNDVGNPQIVIFDYRTPAWSTWSLADDDLSGPSCLDSEGRMLVGAAGDVLRETPSRYGDGETATNPVVSTITAPWLRVGAIAGFQRVRRVMLTGAAGSAASVQLELRHDFNNGTVDTGAWSIAAPMSPMQLDHHVKHQKGTALSVRITESGVADDKGANFFGIALEVGLLRGRAKVSQNNRSTPGGT